MWKCKHPIAQHREQMKDDTAKAEAGKGQHLAGRQVTPLKNSD